MTVVCDTCTWRGAEAGMWTYWTTTVLEAIPEPVRKARTAGLSDLAAAFVYSPAMIKAVHPVLLEDPAWAVCLDCAEVLSTDNALVGLLTRNWRLNRSIHIDPAHERLLWDEVVIGLTYFWFWRTQRIDRPQDQLAQFWSTIVAAI